MTLFGGPGWLSALEVALNATFFVFWQCQKSRSACQKSRFGLLQIDTGLPEIETGLLEIKIPVCWKSRSACWKSRFGLLQIETGLPEIEIRPATNHDRPAANRDRNLNKISICGRPILIFPQSCSYHPWMQEPVRSVRPSVCLSVRSVCLFMIFLSRFNKVRKLDKYFPNIGLKVPG